MHLLMTKKTTWFDYSIFLKVPRQYLFDFYLYFYFYFYFYLYFYYQSPKEFIQLPKIEQPRQVSWSVASCIYSFPQNHILRVKTWKQNKKKLATKQLPWTSELRAMRRAEWEQCSQSDTFWGIDFAREVQYLCKIDHFYCWFLSSQVHIYGAIRKKKTINLLWLNHISNRNSKQQFIRW